MGIWIGENGERGGKNRGITFQTKSVVGKALSAILVFGILILIGWPMLKHGYSQMLSEKETTKDYKTTVARLTGTTLYEEAQWRDGDYMEATYFLTYTYTANGKEYEYTTEGATAVVPTIGTEREIKYDPKRPGKAVLAGQSQGFVGVFIGGAFVGFTLCFIIGWILEKLNPLPWLDIFSAIMCLFAMAVLYGIVYLMTGEYLPSEILGQFKNYGFIMTLMAIMFVVFFFGIIKSLFFANREWNVYIGHRPPQ